MKTPAEFLTGLPAKTEHRGFTIETCQRNPYAQKDEVEFMFYPTDEGVSHDADQDGDDMKYCGNCRWSTTLQDAMDEIDDLIISEQSERINALEEGLRRAKRDFEMLSWTEETYKHIDNLLNK